MSDICTKSINCQTIDTAKGVIYTKYMRYTFRLSENEDKLFKTMKDFVQKQNPYVKVTDSFIIKNALGVYKDHLVKKENNE